MSEYTARPGSTGDLALRHLRVHGRTAELALSDAIDKPSDELRALLAWPIKQGAISREQIDGQWFYGIGLGVPVAPPAAAPAPSPAPAPESQITIATNAAAAAVSPAAGGSQKPNDAAAIPRAKAGRLTPRKGANRDPSTGRSHDTGECASSAGRAENVGPACAVAPAFLPKKLTPEERDSQHVLKAEGPGPDATDRETPVMTSPRVGATGASQPADAGAPAEPIRIALWSDGKLHIARPGGHLVVFQREETRQIVQYLDSIALDVVRGDAR